MISGPRGIKDNYSDQLEKSCHSPQWEPRWGGGKENTPGEGGFRRTHCLEDLSLNLNMPPSSPTNSSVHFSVAFSSTEMKALRF